MTTITVDPATRLEGHLKIRTQRDDLTGRISAAWSGGMLYRGFEALLGGKDPRDAIQVTQRVCGVCPISHAMTAALAIESAARLTVTDNARIIRNLILGADYLHSHVLQFYQLSLPDFLSFEGTALDMAPWTSGYNVDLRFSVAETARLVGNYVEALKVRRQAHEMGAILAGKLPQTSAYEYGGVAVVPNAEMVSRFRVYLDGVISFIEGSYLPDVDLLTQKYPDYLEIGKGYGNLLSFGVFDLDSQGSARLLSRGRAENGRTTGADGQPLVVDPAAIAEQIQYSWYTDTASARNPSQGVTNPNPEKAGAYSWLKAPRYGGLPYETGPLARMYITGVYRNGVSVIDRHKARALEAQRIALAMRAWLGQLSLAAAGFIKQAVPVSGSGFGLSEAPRGALGHWLTVSGSKIASYQILTPTCWNFSPRDIAGSPGPLERALEGTPVKDPAQPVEVLRVVHSFDPCLACAVH